MSIATSWGVTQAEADRTYPCDDLLPDPGDRLLRGVDVAAPADVVFRWVCQFRAAPYSYDWVDNLGHRSPPRPLPWCWDLEVGQTFSTIFRLESFVVGEHLTFRMIPGPSTRVFGDIVVTYAVVPVGPEQSRLLAVVRGTPPTSRAAALRDRLLAWGDLLMMRKQLLTFAALAAREHAERAQSTV
ncbi:SRPBCC family protein [Cellulomonas sp. P5_C5]